MSKALIVFSILMIVCVCSACGHMTANVRHGFPPDASAPSPVPAPAPAPAPAPVVAPPPTDPNAGLLCTVYSIGKVSDESSVNWGNLFIDATPLFTDVVSQLNAPEVSGSDAVSAMFNSTEQTMMGHSNYALDCRGYINFPETTYYNVDLASDDAVSMILDDQWFIQNNVPHAYTDSIHQQAFIGSGKHAVTIVYFQAYGGSGLTLSWQTNGGGTMQPIPSSALSH